MRASLSGTRDGVDWPRAGEQIDLPDVEAADLCAAGVAIPVVVSDKRTAVAPKTERRKA